MSVPYQDGVPITDDVVTGASFTAGKMTLTKQVGTDITASVGGFYSAQVTSDDADFDVQSGNPTTANAKAGEITGLTVTGINGNATKVLLQFSIMGEWDINQHDAGIVIARRTSDTIDGTYADDTILRADVAGSNNGRFIQNFNLAWRDSDNTTSMESCNGMYIDTPTANKFHKYSIVLVNSSSDTKEFKLNRVVGGNDHIGYERGTSCFTAQEF